MTCARLLDKGERRHLRDRLTGGDDGEGDEEWCRACLLDDGERRLRDPLTGGGGDEE